MTYKEAKAFRDILESVVKAWKLYQDIVRQHGPRSLNLPVAIIEATSRTSAVIGSGHVWWTDGKFRGAPVDPRQMRFAAERF
jgi:hypothetical protein